MYQPLHEETAVQQIQKWVDGFGFDPSPDGLVVTPPGNFKGGFDYLHIPERLREWLVGLRLLRGVPLTHLVPDPALLPPESIRFFHVDPTWTDRLVDGALSVASTGSTGISVLAAALGLIRAGLDDEVEQIARDQEPDVPWEAGKNPMTGMLIRSELVRRWPDLVVRATQGAEARSLGILRREPISRDVLIALFAGQPTRVEVREPDVAMRFGVEPGNTVNLRGFDGQFVWVGGDPITLDVPFSSTGRRVLDISLLRDNIKDKGTAWTAGTPGRDPGARDIALNLEQLPYVQVFTTEEKEEQGSKSALSFTLAAGKPAIMLRNGRFVHTEKIVARAASFTQAEIDD